jgi:hypothetical protein
MNKCIGILLLILFLSGCKEKTINLGKDISFDQEMDVSAKIRFIYPKK